MRQKTLMLVVLCLALIFGSLLPRGEIEAAPLSAPEQQSGGVTAFDLIIAMNTLRVSNGLPALIEDPIVNAVAQTTAEIMAANQMSWHIGDVRGRIQAAGYGGGAQVWATENFAVGQSMGIDQIMLAWADPDHMRPAVNPAYCHVGAGVARASNGRIYYVLQAAYTSGNSCGEYTSNPGGGDSGDNPPYNPVPQIIFPVSIATPDSEGEIYHVVEFGQSFWAIAIAYQITIDDLEFWNNLSRENDLQVGQRLFIPTLDTVGYATPTPVGMVVPSEPDSEGKIVHTVESYHTLTTISDAYTVSIDRIVSLNGIQTDWPLQIGQKLLIDPGAVTPTPTPLPLSPLQRVTPASDGKYYHTVASGETLSGIARFYEIELGTLLGWNNLNTASIIRPGEQLELVVPTPTPTTTPLPPTLAPASPTLVPSSTSTASPTAAVEATPQVEDTSPDQDFSGSLLVIGGVLSFFGIGLLVFFGLRRRIG